MTRIFGIILLFAPAILFIVDQQSGVIPGDSFTWSLVLGGIGLILLAMTQRATLQRVLIVLLGGITLLAAQYYAIAAIVI